MYQRVSFMSNILKRSIDSFKLKQDYDIIEGEYYSRSHLFKWWHDARFSKGLESVREIGMDTLIADLGCNGANFTHRLSELGQVVGLDISGSFIASARKRVGDGSFVISDINYTPFREGVFHLVACMEVLEHLPNPRQAVSESWRILREKGRFFISTPDDGKLLWRFIWFFWENIGRGVVWRHKHIYKFNRMRLLDLVSREFTNIRIDYVNFFLLILMLGEKKSAGN